MQLVERFVLGGVLVACFAVLGDVLRPKSFAGLFSAAPSIGLADLCLTLAAHGRAYAALEARSMAVGALAFLIFALLCLQGLFHGWFRAKATYAMLAVWGVCAFGGWLLLLRSSA